LLEIRSEWLVRQLDRKAESKNAEHRDDLVEPQRRFAALEVIDESDPDPGQVGEYRLLQAQSAALSADGAAEDLGCGRGGRGHDKSMR
jgi:hypothetical protein